MLTCEHCQRTISDAFVTDSEVRRHAICPPGTCASCKAEIPYADLTRIELADGEIDPDPDLLACTNVYACQVRAGEIDPDDVPRTVQR